MGSIGEGPGYEMYTPEQREDEINCRLKGLSRINVVVVGKSDEVAISILAKKMDFDFHENAINVIIAGRASNIPKLVRIVKMRLILPLVVVADNDFHGYEARVETVNRSKDIPESDFILVPSNNIGEFVECFPFELFIRSLNNLYSPDNLFGVCDIDQSKNGQWLPQATEILKEKCGIGINRIKLLEIMAQDAADVPEIIKFIINKLKALRKRNPIVTIDNIKA